MLGAVERSGEASAVANVERLANLRRPRPADQPVVAAARRCLDSLYKQAGRNREAETLLRGASAPDAADRLLCPACTADSDPAELLRPAQDDTTE